GTTNLVSVNLSSTAAANGSSHTPIMSADGQRVAFLSDSSELVVGATNRIVNIYLRDLSSATTHLITRNTSGDQSRFNHELKAFAIAPDGSYVAFESEDSTLVNGDLNGEM